MELISAAARDGQVIGGDIRRDGNGVTATDGDVGGVGGGRRERSGDPSGAVVYGEFPCAVGIPVAGSGRAERGGGGGDDREFSRGRIGRAAASGGNGAEEFLAVVRTSHRRDDLTGVGGVGDVVEGRAVVGAQLPLVGEERTGRAHGERGGTAAAHELVGRIGSERRRVAGDGVGSGGGGGTAAVATDADDDLVLVAAVAEGGGGCGVAGVGGVGDRAERTAIVGA